MVAKEAHLDKVSEVRDGPTGNKPAGVVLSADLDLCFFFIFSGFVRCLVTLLLTLT